MQNIYESIDFGSRVAEDEASDLSSYFLSTRYWNNLIRGKTDVILGPKGSGKSALYLHLIKNRPSSFPDNIFIFEAENPRGETLFSIFGDLNSKAPYKKDEIEYSLDPKNVDFLVERDIVAFWKLYFLTIIITKLKENKFQDTAFSEISTLFEECGLIPEEKSLKNVFRYVLHYLKQVVTLKFFQPEIEIDPTLGTIKAIKGKISFEELTPEKLRDGFFTLDDLFDKINKSLSNNNKFIWVLIDRLDIAFQDDILLESRALKALFTVYNSLKSRNQIKLKIFLRDDIFQKITYDGMREASHITKKETIQWNDDNLFNLIIKRLLSNEIIIERYCNENSVKDIEDNFTYQKELFYRLYPSTISKDNDSEEDCFNWILEMVKDGNGIVTPREIIHFFNEINNSQSELNNLGIKLYDEKLYSEKAIKNAFIEVSNTKLELTLFAENPGLIDKIKLFKGSNSSINTNWVMNAFDFKSETDAKTFCEGLTKIGFLKKINFNEYWIPYIYKAPLDSI